MADTFSFDIFSEVNESEVLNAVQQANKEHKQRFDLKNSNSDIEFLQKDHKLLVTSVDEYSLNSVLEILRQKLVKRGVSLKALEYGKVETAAGNTARQEITLKQGIEQVKAKDMIKDIKASGLKLQAQIMEDKLRVSGKSKDDLQQVMALIRQKDYGIHVEFGNYR